MLLHRSHVCWRSLIFLVGQVVMATCESEVPFGSVVSAPRLEKIEMLRLAMLDASGIRPGSAWVWTAPEREPYSMSAMEGRSVDCPRL